MIDKSRTVLGKEMYVDRHFTWHDNEWWIPLVYLFNEGIAIDFCVKVDNAKVQAFIDKWNLLECDDITLFSREDQRIIEQEQPLNTHTDYELKCDNNLVFRNHHGIGMGWNACIKNQQAYDADMLKVMEHYHLNQEESWIFWRETFEAEDAKGKFDRCKIILKDQKKHKIVSHFQLNEPGEEYVFINPFTQIEHTIKAVDFEQKELSENHMLDNTMVYPKNFVAMKYIMSPPMNQESYYIQDISDGDEPRKKKDIKDSGSVIGFSAGSVSVMGISKQEQNGQQCRVTCSAVHFEPMKEIEWQSVVIDENIKQMSVQLEL